MKMIRLGSLTVIREASVPRFGSSQGRSATWDVFKRWPRAQLGDLSELRIESGDLFHVRGDDIACMPRLTHLTVSNCRTRHFSALSVTDASTNFLAMLRTPAYRAWQCGNREAILKYLDLSDNLLSDFTIDVSAFPNLETVILSGNRLTTIPTFTKDLPKLVSLNLSRNKIVTLQEIHLARPNKLKSLDLSHNQISSWSNVDIFHSDWHHVAFVNLSHNAITLMSGEMMQSLSQVAFDLAGNPFECENCWVVDFQDLLNTHGNNNDLRCQSPQKWLGVPVSVIKLMHCAEDKIYYQVAASVFGLPLGIVLLLMVVLAVRFRFQVNYVWHLVQMRHRAAVTKQQQQQQQQQTQTQQREYDAFVSYSGADRSWVHDVLVTALESPERGYSMCLHERDFRLGAYIIDNVAQSMESSRHVILVLSPNFVASQWCQWEMKLVQQLMFEQQAEDFLVLVELERLPRDKLPSTLRLLMSTRTYLEWNGEQQVFIQRLSNALGKPLARTHSDVSLRYSKNTDVSLRFCARNAEVSLHYSTNTDVSLRYCSQSSDEQSLKL
ncbi:hypothetical protein B566_EDAN010439 [Ephemera danica]|nr:hypothetical protein B566_EDAN010439 [Ephemera danica]